MIWYTTQAAFEYRARQPPPLPDPPPPKRARLPTSGSSSGKSPQRPIAQPPLPSLVVSPAVLIQSLFKSSQTLLTAANLVETLSAQAGRTYSDEHGQSADSLCDMAHKFKAIATTTTAMSLHSTHTVPGPPSLPPSPPGSPHTTRAGPAVFSSSAAYPALSTAFTSHTAAIRCGVTRDLHLSPTPFETRPSPGYLDPEIGFTNDAPPRWLNITLSAALATLTWPAIAAARFVSFIWHISHAAWNRLQHSIHANGTTPPPRRPTANHGDPLFHALAGRNRTRATHNANAAHHRPPPTRRVNQPRRPSHRATFPRPRRPSDTRSKSTRYRAAAHTGRTARAHIFRRLPHRQRSHLANAHTVNAAPDTAKTAPPPPPFPAHRRNRSLCAGRHLDTDCELIHGPLPSNRRSCATCSGRHWDTYCPFVRVINLPQAPPFPNVDNRPPTPSPPIPNVDNPPLPHRFPSLTLPPPRPAGPPHRKPPAHRTTLTSPTTPAGHPSRPQPAQTESTTLSTTMPGSLAPSRTAATLKCASTTSATFSTSRSYAWTSSRTPSANTI